MICYLCSKEITEEHYVVNNGYFAHENCNDPGHIVEVPTVSRAGRMAKEIMKRLEGGYVVLSKQDVNQIIEQSNRLPETSELQSTESSPGNVGQTHTIQPDNNVTETGEPSLGDEIKPFSIND